MNRIDVIMIMMWIVILLSLVVIGMVLYMNHIYTQKIKRIKKQNEEQIREIANSIPTLHGRDRVDFTASLFEFVNTLIENELIYIKKDTLILEKGEKHLDFDTVIKHVSTKVFNGIKPDVFYSPDTLVTPDYLMSYIQERTVLSYLGFLKGTIANQL